MERILDKTCNQLIIIDDNIETEIYLSNKEMIILSLLFKSKRNFCTYDDIITALYKDNYLFNREYYIGSIATTICRLRNKIKDYFDLKCIYKKGYKLIVKC